MNTATRKSGRRFIESMSFCVAVCCACGGRSAIDTDTASATTCPSGFVDCEKRCADVRFDHDNCGACGYECTHDQTCIEGICTYTCPAGQTLCLLPTPACVDLNVDASHCGACDRECNQVGGVNLCLSGACTVAACGVARADCDLEAENGCETNVASDPQNCGRCGHDCCGGACVNGQCQPTIIATAEKLASNLAVDVGTAYWQAQHQNSSTPSVLRACETASC